VKRGTFVVPVLVMLASCDDSIVKGWLVNRPRVLAARVEASGDANRASLAPSEHATISWLLAVPDGTPHTAWAYAACAPPIGNLAAPRCDGPVLASGTGAADGEIVPMDLVAPGGDEVLVLATFCPAGRASLDPSTFTGACDTGTDALLASLNVRGASAGANANPRPPSNVRFGTAPIPADDRTPPNATCDAAPSAPVVAPGVRVTFAYALEDADREPGESLVLSVTTTAGKLDHQFYALDPSEPAPKAIEDEWTPPSDDEVAPGGRIVRFYFVLRDGRGGAGFTRLAVCVRR
jgi:hypothetical protein